MLYGEGQYNLNVVKEVEVTDSYMGMNVGERGCQNHERYEECTTNHLVESLLSQCHCLPPNMRTLNKVIQNIVAKFK